MGIFDSACPTPAGSENYNTHGSAWKPMLIAAFACTCATISISISLITLHLRRYRAPQEQRQIIRISFSVVIYSLVALCEIYSYEVVQYIDPIGDVYESFGLCALFLLFIQYAAPSGKVHGDHFAAVKAAEETETLFDWPRISWISVFQYPIIELASVVILEATEATGRYCTNSLEPQFAHLWVELIETVSIGACVIAIVSFRGHMKQLFKVKRGIPKLVCFKATVFLRFAQAWAFSTLLSYGVIKTSSSLSYNDIIWGMPGLCTCAEMVLFSLGFWYAFSSTEYSSTAKPYEQPLPLGKAILDALNPSDLVLGIARIFPIWGEVHRKGDWKKWLVAQRETGIIGFVRRSVTKFKDRKDASNGQRPYKELNESMEALTKPIESYHGRSESELTQKGAESYPMTAMGGPELYQPPSTTPPDEVDGHLKADAYPGGPRSPSPGRWNGQTYDRSHSPTATYGREMV